MTNSDSPPKPPTLTLVERLYAVHNINSLVPEKLDLDEANYSSWCYFFKGHCTNFGVSTSTPPTDEWLTADSIVKSWIFLTLSSTLRKRLIKANPKTAKAAWDTIEKIFQDNKRTRTIALKGELRVIQMGEQTADTYFSKIGTIITLLNDLGSTMDDDDVVSYANNGLSDKYGSLTQIIAHKDPFPDLATVRSMVTTEEMRLRCKTPLLSDNNTSSVPQVLLTTTRTQDNSNNRSGSTDRNSRTTTKTEVCRNFSRGFCRWGAECRFLHNSTGTTRTNNSGTSQSNSRNTIPSGNTTSGLATVGLTLAAQQQLMALLQAQNNLLAQYGINPSISQHQAHVNSLLGSRPTHPPGFSTAQQATPPFTQQQQALLASTVNNLGIQSAPQGQETLLPQAFNAMTLQDPANANLNMDTGFLDPSNSTPM